MRTLSGPLAELVRKLDTLGPRPSVIELSQAIEQSHLTTADVSAFVETSPHCYNRAPVVLREHYEMLVMTWAPGQASVPHDHSGSVCVLRVLQGRAAEGCYRIAKDGYADLDYEQVVQSGETASFEDAGVHTIRNASPNGETLVTLHVYAPPLRECRRFQPRPEPRQVFQQATPDDIPTIAIVGGGFSGSMTAAQILRRAKAPLRVVLVERRGTIGEGVAYSTREPWHLLNVPAGKMSAWPDRPEDFAEWAQRRKKDVLPSDFLPRQWYGEYIRDTLHATFAAADPDAKLSIVLDEVRRIAKRPGGGWMLHFERGTSLRVDAVVLAIGHCRPSDPFGDKWVGPRTRFISDPWRSFATSAVRPDEPVVILGSGLTAVDVVLSLAQQPRTAQITLVSLNGLLPQGHAVTPLPAADLQPVVSKLTAQPGGVTVRLLLRELRKIARGLGEKGDWRRVVDGLRPYTAELWQGMSSAERRKFIRRLRPFWEVHRHRTAPHVSARFQSLLDSGQVRIITGAVETADSTGNDVRLIVRERGAPRKLELSAKWVVNCTGPMPSNRPESNPAIASLFLREQIQLDEMALGVETTLDGNAIGANGEATPDLFVVGTLRKPAFWESTAVPELREQAKTVAERLLARFNLGNQPARVVCETEAAAQ